jgi:hypothetical protein
MKITGISRLLPGLTFACVMGMAPLAMAQSSSGTMAPMSPPSSMAPMAHTGKMPKADTFTTATAASAHCPGDTVVWSTLSKSKSYHLASSNLYGKTKHGAYICKGDATSYGFHQAKN